MRKTEWNTNAAEITLGKKPEKGTANYSIKLQKEVERVNKTGNKIRIKKSVYCTNRPEPQWKLQQNKTLNSTNCWGQTLKKSNEIKMCGAS